MSRHSERGFTMIEILLVVLLISIVAGAGLKLPSLIAPTRAFETDVFAIVTGCYRAQTLAATGRDDSAWGVHLEDGAATLFRGSEYALRDDAYDEILPLESDFILSGSSEVVFDSGTASPEDIAVFVLTLDNAVASVSVSTLGVIDYAYAK